MNKREAFDLYVRDPDHGSVTAMFNLSDHLDKQDGLFELPAGVTDYPWVGNVFESILLASAHGCLDARVEEVEHV